MDYVEEQGTLYHFRYPLAGSEEAHLPVATTRPETILGDTAVAVHPEDARYKHLIGQRCVVPLSDGRRATPTPPCVCFQVIGPLVWILRPPFLDSAASPPTPALAQACSTLSTTPDFDVSRASCV